MFYNSSPRDAKSMINLYPEIKSPNEDKKNPLHQLPRRFPFALWYWIDEEHRESEDDREDSDDPNSRRDWDESENRREQNSTLMSRRGQFLSLVDVENRPTRLPAAPTDPPINPLISGLTKGTIA